MTRERRHDTAGAASDTAGVESERSATICRGSVRRSGRRSSERTNDLGYDMALPPTVNPTFCDRQRWFLRSVATVDEDEMDCEAALELLSRLVEAGDRDRIADAAMAGVNLHVMHCRHCADVYETLLTLVDMENADAVPDVDTLFLQVRQVTAPAADQATRPPKSRQP